MPKIPVATFIVRTSGIATIAPGLLEDRCVRTAEARENLPKGTITIDANDCFAVADGNGGFQTTGMDGTYPGNERVVLPASSLPALGCLR